MPLKKPKPSKQQPNSDGLQPNSFVRYVRGFLLVAMDSQGSFMVPTSFSWLEIGFVGGDVSAKTGIRASVAGYKKSRHGRDRVLTGEPENGAVCVWVWVKVHENPFPLWFAKDYG